ncbi:MAG TPA: transglycosylase SLT domain-containing protein [Acidobacteriota bacterium]|nr:transglycosylase SLT domain-containing protein [Acidobacteriota bacterium]
MSRSRSSQDARAWLVRLRKGSEEGARHALRGDSLRIGRDPSCDFVPEGPKSRVVSAHHAEIRRDGKGGFRLVDLDSTNGTFIDGKRVERARLKTGNVIMLGPDGPSFRFHTGAMPASTPERTLMLERSQTGVSGKGHAVQAPSGETPLEPDAQRSDDGRRLGELRGPEAAGPAEGASASSAKMRSEGTRDAEAGRESRDDRGRSRRRKRKSVDELAEDAVLQARRARNEGQLEGQTIIFMREALEQAVTHSKRKWKLVAGVLAVALVGMSAYAWWAVQDVRRQKNDLDYHIRRIESDLANAQDSERLKELSQRLEEYQERAEGLRRSIFFELAAQDDETDFIDDQLRLLLQEFGAEQYSLPPSFVERVRDSIRHFQENDRGSIEQVLIDRRQDFERIRQTLADENLPPDLAYMVVVESGFRPGSYSPRGAAGPWQMVPVTARSYGLTINDQVDERLDMEKSTHAAARYIRHLILEFGTGSSILLALAAYNTGQTRVKRIIRSNVDDPMRQRNFWYLYRIKALPGETRNYVPKVMAAILIGRNPQRFGFAPTMTD